METATQTPTAEARDDAPHGVFDTSLRVWLGNESSNGPLLYHPRTIGDKPWTAKDQARVAAGILNEQFKYRHHRLIGAPFPAGAKLIFRDSIEVEISAEKAIDNIEARAPGGGR